MLLLGAGEMAQLAAREDYLPNTLFERSVSGSAWRGSTITFRTDPSQPATAAVA